HFKNPKTSTQNEDRDNNRKLNTKFTNKRKPNTKSQKLSSKNNISRNINNTIISITQKTLQTIRVKKKTL
ncbi:hypothetical protein NQU36_27055, partial [Escherichia coli]|uniref:hypothetical protein n=1 Tax=Escherichia coli TaxID=562 RepID=UPI002117BB6A